MRFDDMLATVLAQAEGNPSARAAKWRQLVDLLAQQRTSGDDAQLAEAVAFLRSYREELPTAMRREVARALSGRRVSPLLVLFFAEDLPPIAATIIGSAQLPPEEWLAILPRLTPTARALLRHRRDLDRQVGQALASFGSVDLVLPGTTEIGRQASPAAEQGEAQIRELVARIEAFRAQKAAEAHDPLPAEAEERIDSFRWETGADGIIHWVEGAPRGPLIGQTIAMVAGQGAFGVDGQAAGAFEKRSPFRDARFSVAPGGVAGGDWRVSGVPFFEPRRGTFLGYRGTARRPRLDEVAQPFLSDSGLFGTSLPADSLRQLVHELRTPLNAILGFAEMIDGQYMGPASSHYRLRARDIMDQATRLLSAVDDLDTAARIETRRLALGESVVDAAALLCRLQESYQRVAAQRGASIAVDIEPLLPSASVETAAAERMLARLLAATIGLSRDGEVIAASMTAEELNGRSMLRLSIDRPAAIAGLDEVSLLDPGYSPEGDWPGAPALGLGFALRLVRNLAEASGGALVIERERFVLYLPTNEGAGRSKGQGGQD